MTLYDKIVACLNFGHKVILTDDDWDKSVCYALLPSGKILRTKSNDAKVASALKSKDFLHSTKKFINSGKFVWMEVLPAPHMNIFEEGDTVVVLENYLELNVDGYFDVDGRKENLPGQEVVITWIDVFYWIPSYLVKEGRGLTPLHVPIRAVAPIFKKKTKKITVTVGNKTFKVNAEDAEDIINSIDPCGCLCDDEDDD